MRVWGRPICSESWIWIITVALTCTLIIQCFLCYECAVLQNQDNLGRLDYKKTADEAEKEEVMVNLDIIPFNEFRQSMVRMVRRDKPKRSQGTDL